MQGYCDAFYKCRRVDADGPLARLKNLLFNPATLNTIKEWIVVSRDEGFVIADLVPMFVSIGVRSIGVGEET